MPPGVLRPPGLTDPGGYLTDLRRPSLFNGGLEGSAHGCTGESLHRRAARRLAAEVNPRSPTQMIWVRVYSRRSVLAWRISGVSVRPGPDRHGDTGAGDDHADGDLRQIVVVALAVAPGPETCLRGLLDLGVSRRTLFDGGGIGGLLRGNA
jgi:hypothetical protein